MVNSWSLYREIENNFTNLALKNERNFRIVVKRISEFIKTNLDKYDKVNFLYAYLEILKRQFYFLKAQNISINDVLLKLKTVSI